MVSSASFIYSQAAFQNFSEKTYQYQRQGFPFNRANIGKNNEFLALRQKGAF